MTEYRIQLFRMLNGGEGDEPIHVDAMDIRTALLAANIEWRHELPLVGDRVKIERWHSVRRGEWWVLTPTGWVPHDDYNENPWRWWP